jgi:phytol kinase
MVHLLIIVVAVFLLLAVSETLWRRHDFDPEYTRKFIHITVGSFVAFWPLFLDRRTIVGLSIAFVIVVLASHYFDMFKAIRSVQRPTWGEMFFAISVGVLAYVSSSGWIYLVALLHMSLADGLAALIGTKFGHRTRYYVFGHPKSVVGTLTFIAISLGIFAGYCAFTATPFSPWFVPIALGAAAIENVAIRGLDNLLVPLFVALCLNAVR